MNSRIQWNASDIQMPELNYERLEQWIVRVANSYGRVPMDINYIFCDDDEILRINRQFLAHDYFTDIISFDNSFGRSIRGDIFISLDTVRSNAIEFNQPFQRELLRVIIHGILHFCGINDKGPGERELMENAENQALKLYDSIS